MIALLDRREEGVHVEMKDDAVHAGESTGLAMVAWPPEVGDGAGLRFGVDGGERGGKGFVAADEAPFLRSDPVMNRDLHASHNGAQG